MIKPKEKPIVQKDDMNSVAVKYYGKLFPGLVVKKTKTYYTDKCMTPIGANWKWPEKKDIFTYEAKDVLCAIAEPVQINSRGHFKINHFPEIERHGNYY